ncbi:MAG: DNA primase, partial [Candidatus Dadabacteria bacterium]|nr:DNA primase [Candidatus Dadabacteria bacterium]
DLLLKGKSGEFFDSLFKAKKYRPDGIVGVDDLYQEALRPVVRGLSWPWETLTKVTYGIRRQEIYGFGAGSGCGKTEG